MIKINNASIRIKTLIAPGIAVLAMVAVTIAFLVSFERTGTLRHQATQASAQAETISGIKADLSLAHSSVLRANLWTANSIPQENIDKVANTAREILERMRESLEGVIAEKNEANAAQLEALVQKLAAYTSVSHGVLDVLSIDAFLAAMDLNDAEQKLSELVAMLDETGHAMSSRAEELKAQADFSLEQELVVVLSVLAIGAALSLGVAWFMARAISSPVTGLTAVMTRLANKDTSIEIPSRGRGDEIGQMAEAVQVFKDNAIEQKRLEAAAAEETATKEQRARAIEELVSGFDRTVGEILHSVSASAGGLDETAQRMSKVAEQTKMQSSAAATASGRTTENVQTVAAASEELASSIQEISRQVAKSKDIADQAVSEANGTNEKVQGLAGMARKISDVITLIQDIAEQTNLLALNATIEAARAGDAGKGFAVVAGEVKNLATQTARATEEIGSQIGSIQTATNEAAEAISSIGGTIEKINEITTGIASAVEEQSAATGEISSNAQLAASGTQETSSTVAQVAEAAGETGVASGQVLNAAKELGNQSDMLRGEIERFLNGIRAA